MWLSLICTALFLHRYTQGLICWFLTLTVVACIMWNLSVLYCTAHAEYSALMRNTSTHDNEWRLASPGYQWLQYMQTRWWAAVLTASSSSCHMQLANTGSQAVSVLWPLLLDVSWLVNCHYVTANVLKNLSVIPGLGWFNCFHAVKSD